MNIYKILPFHFSSLTSSFFISFLSVLLADCIVWLIRNQVPSWWSPSITQPTRPVVMIPWSQISLWAVHFSLSWNGRTILPSFPALLCFFVHRWIWAAILLKTWFLVLSTKLSFTYGKDHWLGRLLILLCLPLVICLHIPMFHSLKRTPFICSAGLSMMVLSCVLSESVGPCIGINIYCPSSKLRILDWTWEGKHAILPITSSFVSGTIHPSIRQWNIQMEPVYLKSNAKRPNWHGLKWYNNSHKAFYFCIVILIQVELPTRNLQNSLPGWKNLRWKNYIKQRYVTSHWLWPL